VICTKAATVPEIIDACGRAGCKNAIIISGGFAEAGPRGACAGARRAGKCPPPRHAPARPQLPRHHAPGSQLNLTFAHGSANPGTIGLISQSGALCTAILDWALPNKVGFSNVVSLGRKRHRLRRSARLHGLRSRAPRTSSSTSKASRTRAAS
jgi:acetyltransferase